MSLIDLRRRHGEPGVLDLLAHAQGSDASLERALVRYGDGRWVLIGWEEDGQVVACAGVERRGQSDVVLRSVAVAPEQRGRGVGRALLDALARSVSAQRLVAETDGDAAGFYARCGFTLEPLHERPGRVRCIRELPQSAAPSEAVRSFTLTELETAVRRAWGRDTSEDPDEWSEDNPARGQCTATALLVRDLLGGEIVVANVLRDGERIERHAWNRLSSGLSVDLTRAQFTRGEQLDEPSPEEPIPGLTDPVRARLLADRVYASLSLEPPGDSASQALSARSGRRSVHALRRRG